MYPQLVSIASARRLPARHLVAAGAAAMLFAGPLSPSWVSADRAQFAAPVVGGFGLGDHLEALLDERDGAVALAVPVAGLTLAWDSRRAGDGGRYGLGAGWSFGLGALDTSGGVRLVAPDGSAYEMDAEHASGLAGYDGRALSFVATPGERVPARTDGAAGESPEQAYVVHELGGMRTSYSADGDPLSRQRANRDRIDWAWAPDQPHRLLRVTDADGVTTELDWEHEPDALVVTPGANLPASPSERGPRSWRVSLDGDRVASIDDPDGGSTRFEYAGDLIRRVITSSGAHTEISWQRAADGVARAGLVRTIDRAGRELSSRTWRQSGAVATTGWPALDMASASLAGASTRYETELSDGATTARSEFGGRGALLARSVIVSTGSGARAVQEHAYTYADPSAPSSGAHAVAARPVSAELTSRDEFGAVKTMRAEYDYDDLGELVREVAPDGTVTETSYDRDDPDGPGPLLPTGLPLSSTVTAPDGLVSETVQTLDPSRAAVVAIETRSGTRDDGLVAVSRVERTVEPDGFVSEERRYPDADAAKHPLTTRWQRSVDLPAGTATTTETVAVGTTDEAAVSSTVSLLHGGVVAERGPDGIERTATYDAVGRVLERADASGTTTCEYERLDRDGRNAISVTGPDGVSHTEVRDELGRVIRLLDSIDRGVATPGHERVVETREYPDPGTVRITDAWGATTTTRQDAFGRVVETATPSGAVQVNAYDDVAGTVTSGWTTTGALADAELRETAHHDAAGRVIATHGERRDGLPVPATTSTFDGFGRPTAGSDHRLRTAIGYDDAGNATTTTLTPVLAAADEAADGGDGGSGVDGAGVGAGDGPAGEAIVAQRRFDGFGTTLEKTLHGGGQARSGGAREVDSFGREVAAFDQLGREQTTAYTPDGLVVRVEAAAGQVIEHEYDDATRLPVRTTVSAPGRASVTTEFVHDVPTGRVTSQFDPAERAGTEIRTAYDDFGNVLSVEYPDGARIEHEYDGHGRRVKTTDVAGLTSSYAYDSAGQLSGVVQRDVAQGVVAEVSYARDAFGRVTRMDYGNGVVTTYAFSSMNEVERQVTTRDGVELSVREYAYAPDGRVTSRVDRVRDHEEAPFIATTTVYAYDGLRRLVGSAVHDGEHAGAAPSRSTEYAVSAPGDILTETVATRGSSPTSTTREFEYSPLGELRAIITDGVRAEQAYDAAGNVIRATDGVEYAYDALDRPVSRRIDGRTEVISYWPDGSRRELTSTAAGDVRGEAGSGDASPESSTTRYYWADGMLMNDLHTGAGGTGSASYLLGSTRHARTTIDDTAARPGAPFETPTDAPAAGTRYLGADRHGSIVELTDAAGGVVERYDYTDYGVVTETGRSVGADGLARNPFRFAGELTDLRGTQWLAVRMYDTATMRFLSPDKAPVHNTYNFADLDPVRKVDPSGRTAHWDTIVDGSIAGVAALFVAVTLAAAVFTGGWSLTGLGALGLLSDTVAVSASTARILSRETSLTVDPLAEQLLFGAEAAGGALGALGAGFTIFGLRQAYRVHRAEQALAKAETTLDAAMVAAARDRGLLETASGKVRRLATQPPKSKGGVPGVGDAQYAQVLQAADDAKTTAETTSASLKALYAAREGLQTAQQEFAKQGRLAGFSISPTAAQEQVLRNAKEVYQRGKASVQAWREMFSALENGIARSKAVKQVESSASGGSSAEDSLDELITKM